MHIIVPIIFILIGVISAVNPEKAYRLNMNMQIHYAKLVKNIHLLREMAEATIKANESLDLVTIKHFGVFAMIIGSIFLFVSIFGS